MLKHIVILSFVIIAFVIYFIGYLFTRTNRYEYFTSTSCNIPEYNLLHNGSFQNGKDIKELYQNNGNNKIIHLANPLKCSPCVLSQQGLLGSRLTTCSYIIKYPAKAGSNYKFSLWVAQTSDWNCSADGIVNFKLGSANLDGVRYSVADKTPINTITWQLYEFYFTTPSTDSLFIGIGNYPPTVRGVRYATGLQLVPYLPSDINFEYTIGLKTFLNASKFDGNTNIWEDESNANAVWSWKNKPSWSQTYFRTNNNVLTGFPSKNLEGRVQKGFTIIIRSRANLEVVGTAASTAPALTRPQTGGFSNLEGYDNMSPLDISNNEIQPTPMQHVPALSASSTTPMQLLRPFSALYMGGNQGVALEIGIPNTNDVISLNIGGRIFQTMKTVNPQLEHTYTFIYSKKSTGYAMDIWLNDMLFESFTNVPVLYFNNDAIRINRNLTWHANLYNVLLYNVPLDKSIIPDVYKYIAGLIPLPLQPVLIPLQPAIPAQPLQPLTDDQVQQACYNDCRRYSDDIWKCRKKSANCREMCSRPNFANDPVCYTRPNRNCPHVECKHGTYYVNRQSYGKDKRRARRLYSMNYPNCPVPKLLRRDSVDPADCPFVIQTDENPCKTDACDGVDWSKDYPTMSRRCKMDVADYCRKYGETDPACKCWSRRERDTQTCQNHRRHYEQPEDYNFTINDYNIKMHTDYDKVFDKGVKRGIGMCWGCST